MLQKSPEKWTRAKELLQKVRKFYSTSYELCDSIEQVPDEAYF